MFKCPLIVPRLDGMVFVLTKPFKKCTLAKMTHGSSSLDDPQKINVHKD